LGQCIDDINGAGKENRIALEASRIAKCCCQMRFTALMSMPF
jgi:hypothetical protein